MKILMVSPYPPVRDGIAAYGQQAVAALRAQGHDVEVLSPGPSAAHHHLHLVGPRGGLALAKRVRAYDKVIVQFHPDIFYPVPATPGDRVRVGLALAAAFRLAHRVEVVLHEIDYRHGRGTSPAALVTRALWRNVDHVAVHSTIERDRFAESFGYPLDRVTVVDHGASFVPHTPLDRAAARRSLGLDPDAHIFLSIGFVQPHKGFDRALRAFQGLGDGAELHIVGSVRVEEPDFVRYAQDLEDLAARIPGAHVHLGYVSDELFDRWIVASDVLVLPYREIWSSGVLERALMFGRSAIATRVGALMEQAGDAGVRFVDGDAELREAMWASLGRTAAPPADEPWPETLRERSAVQREIVRRAARVRGELAPTGPASSAASAATGLDTMVKARVTAPLRRHGDLHLPPPVAGRGVRSLAQRVVRKLTAWQVQPVVDQVNALRHDALEALDRAVSVSGAPGAGSGSDPMAADGTGATRAAPGPTSDDARR